MMIQKLQRKFALSEQGAGDLLKAGAACTLQYAAFMLPVGLLYEMVCELLQGGVIPSRVPFYAVGSLLCLIAIFAVSGMQYNATFIATYAETGVRRVSLAERLRKIPLSFFGDRDLADLTSTIMADCTSLETAFSHYIPELAGSMMCTAMISVSLFLFDWRMAAAAVGVVPAAFCVIFSSAGVQERMQQKGMAAKMACADGIQECIEILQDLKANNAEELYLRRLDQKIKAVERRSILNELGTAVFVVSSSMILRLDIAATALAGAAFLIDGSLSVPVFFMFLLAVSRLYDPLYASLQNLAAIIATRTNIARMNEILDYPIQGGAALLDNRGYDIAFDHVSFSYSDGMPVISDLSFTAKQGEVTALVGPSGGGKTTVSRLAARFWDVSKGKITLGGRDISGIDPETLLSLYSIVFQDVTLFNNTVMENIRLGKSGASDEEVREAARLANCDEFIEKLPDGWNSFIGENGCALSGGERQRISIARAFLKDAPVILLDEATASLDAENETLIQEALSRLIRDKTVLVIAHRMRTVAAADKIVVLAGGTAAEQGTPEELIQKGGIFAHMTALQRQSLNWALQ